MDTVVKIRDYIVKWNNTGEGDWCVTPSYTPIRNSNPSIAEASLCR